MKERELLRPVRGIVRAVEIKDEIGRMLIRPVGVGTEPVNTRARQPLNCGPVDRILEPRQRRLRPERRAAIGRDHLEGRIMPQAVGIVDVLVPGDDLIQPLAHERVQVVRGVARVSRVGDSADHIAAEPESLIEFSNEQQAGIGGERAARKINDEFRLESEAKLRITVCSHRTSSVAHLRGLRHRESTTTFSRAMAFLCTHS